MSLARKIGLGIVVTWFLVGGIAHFALLNALRWQTHAPCRRRSAQERGCSLNQRDLHNV